MPDRSYRLYQLSVEGRIKGALNLEFDDDRSALSHAREMLDAHPGIEIWQTTRLVGRVDRCAQG